MDSNFPAGSVKDDLDAFNQGEGDAESRGGDHRPVPDHGTGGRTSNVSGENTFRGDYPLPPDPNAPEKKGYDSSGAGEEISDLGINETVEVGTDQATTAGNYGVDGPAAGGGKSHKNSQG